MNRNDPSRGILREPDHASLRSEEVIRLTPDATGRIRAVSFDVGGTLIEPWPSVGHVYAEAAARFGIQGVAPDALTRQFRAAWKARRAFDYSREAWRELVNASFAGLWPEPPGLDCFDAMYDAFARPEPWRIFDDVIPTLAAVRERGWKLAVVSNWDERLRPLLRELKLIDHFDAVVISHEAGVTKPAPQIFRRAAAQLNLPVEDILHVGDSTAEDCLGARAAGMRSLLLDRRGGGEEKDAVRSLAAVTELEGR